MTKYHQGLFRPKNPSKYKGNVNNIIYRSSWEFRVLMLLDSHPDVLEYSSEEIVIPYISVIDGRRRRYFPDFYVKKRNHSDGKIEEWLIEIKPKKETKPPTIQSGKKPNKRYLMEVEKWGVNSSKWEAAQKYCQARGWKFQIMNEDHLGIKF